MKHFLRDLLIGRKTYIPSYKEYKRTLLVGYICLISLVVEIFYLGVASMKAPRLMPEYGFLVAVSLISLYLNRKRNQAWAITLQLIMANIFTFYFAWRGNNTGGTHLFFISSGLGAFAFFGYEERGKAFAFLISGIILFIIAYFGLFGPFVKNINNFYAIHIFMLFLSTTVVIYFTISLGHHSEKQLTEKNDLLTKANAELDRFVYSASHDLRAPLSSLLGLIEIARKSDNPEENKIFLDMMKERVQKLDQFIHEIIDYSRNSRLDVKNESIKVLEMIKEVVEGLKFAEGLEEVYVRYSIDPALEIQSDRSRLKVILNNLIGNAMKYQDATKEDQMVSVEVLVENSYAKIIVADNGIGIADEHKEKIFDMFYRASEKSKGSGLGLYIVKETVQKMQGTICLESEYCKGTTFTLSLPDGNPIVAKKKSVLKFKQPSVSV